MSTESRADSPQQGMSGVGALVLATIINVLGLAALRWRGAPSESALACLSVAYLVAGIVTGGLARQDHAPRAPLRHSLAWALALALIYVQFLIVEEKASLSQLIILQAVAPLFSGFFSREVRGFSKAELLFQGGALAILVFLAQAESVSRAGHSTVTVSTTLAASIAIWGRLAILLGAYVVSQFVLRSAVRRGHSRSKLLMDGCFAVSILLGALAAAGNSGWGSFQDDALFGAIFGLVLVVIQLLYVEGVRRARGVLGNLALSAAVPISLLVQGVMTQHLSAIGTLLSLVYCGLLVTATTLGQKRAQGTPGTRRSPGSAPDLLPQAPRDPQPAADSGN